jgi:hypothetical protein
MSVHVSIRTPCDQETLTSPIGFGDRVETANLLAAGVVLEEFDSAGDVNFALLLGQFLLFRSDGNRTKATAVLDHILKIAEESRMPMQVDLAVFGFVPFRIEQQILSVE